MDQRRDRLRLVFLGFARAAVEQVRECGGGEVGRDALSFLLGEHTAASVLGDHVPDLVQDDVILVEAAGVLGVGDHVVIAALLPGTAAAANGPGDSAEIDVAAAMAFQPVEELVDVPGVRDTGVLQEVVHPLLTAGP